jgi:hypothetical protein
VAENDAPSRATTLARFHLPDDDEANTTERAMERFGPLDDVSFNEWLLFSPLVVWSCGRVHVVAEDDASNTGAKLARFHLRNDYEATHDGTRTLERSTA